MCKHLFYNLTFVYQSCIILCMERINISFTKSQIERMRRYRKETGIGISELLRRLVDEFFKEQDKPHDSRPQDKVESDK